jgi:holliday junction DNA helicase RuvA
MIASIQGKVLHKGNDALVIAIAGVGVEIIATRATHEKSLLGDDTFIYTRLIVREDSLTLYGFISDYERDMFDTLLKVSGVGPKLAIQILSNISLDNLRQAVATERAELLTRVPGIGQKTAKKILLELKDKLPTGLDALPSGGFDDINSDVLDALVVLGFSIVEAQSAIQALPPNAPNDVQERIRLCLQSLSR